jgi:hypothetical protein
MSLPEPVHGPSSDSTNDAARGAATLITTSCTTGWLDWIHGELWLCPDGLLRRSLGLRETVKHALVSSKKQTFDRDNRPTHAFTSDEIEQALGSGPTNRWITWPEIERATLKIGIIDHSLHLQLSSGGRAKFLWLRAHGGFDLLDKELGRVLSERVRVVRRPVG